MENDTFTSTQADGVSLVYKITYILLVIVEIPAILCTSLILIFFFRNWNLIMYKVLHNHVIFLLTLVSFFYIVLDLPFIISSYRLGYDIYRTRSFCMYWYWLDYTLPACSLFLTATASIQRHILVFNASWLTGPRKRWILHYSPLLFCIIYPGVFYLVMIAFYPSPTSDETYCSDPYYSEDLTLFYADWACNVIFPTLVIVAANVALIYRAIHSMNKFHQRQPHIWRKRRKLVLQLLAFSTLYVVGWGPSTVISLIQRLPPLDLDMYAPTLYFINNSSYFVCPLQPFICLFALPELLKFLKRKFWREQPTTNVNVSVVGNILF